MLGYVGKLLLINLSNGKIEKKTLEPEMLRKSLGGRGLGAQLLYDLCPPGTNSFDPEIPFIVLTGPVSGTPILAGCKHIVVTKSPTTGGFLDTYSSGHMASHLKYAGWDGIIILGRSPKPCYLRVEDELLEIKDASHLWGKDAFETEKWLRENVNERGGKLSIGPAGENKIQFACINSDFYRQMGRGGAGAIMGSKNIKAIVVNGTGGIQVKDPQGLLKKLQEVLQMVQKSPSAKNWVRYGTSNAFNISNEGGILPTRNFQTGIYPQALGKIDRDGIEKVKITDHGCPGCFMPCSNIVEIKAGPKSGTRLEGPDYETISLLGSNLGIDDIDFISQANILCDRMGLDTMSMGVCLGFAMECYERGLLTKGQTDGFDLHFGNQDAALQLIEKTAKLEGFGAFLSQGVENMAKIIGKGSDRFAMHTKGLEFAGYDPRGTFGTALNYAVNPRGACHRKAWPPGVEIVRGIDPYTVEGKAKLVKGIYDARASLNHLIVCDYHSGMVPVPHDYYVECLSMVIGEKYTLEELYWVTERTETLTRMFNYREGFSRKHDRMPDRILEDPLPEGPAEGKYIPRWDFEKMLNEYYAIRGWDENGCPTVETLAKYKIK
jgi:aldehyde:ferredoxin oxidoreductase